MTSLPDADLRSSDQLSTYLQDITEALAASDTEREVIEIVLTPALKAFGAVKSVIFTATLGIGIFYLLTMVLRLFGVNVSFMSVSSFLSIGISLFILAIAALNLILDFDMIEQGAERGAPKFMEWYGAFGLLVTLVWLYLEILRLLSKLSSRN